MSKLGIFAQRQLFEELHFLLTHLPGQVAQHLQTPLGKKMASYLQRGLSLAESYRCVGGDALIVGLLVASSDSLSVVVPEIARYYGFLDTLFKNLRKQLLYPLFTLAVAVLVLSGFFIFVYPLLRSMLPAEPLAISWSSVFLSILAIGALLFNIKKFKQLFLTWTQVPQSLKKMQIGLLIQLASDTGSLITMLQRYAPDGSLARSCFQLQKGVSLVRVLRDLDFTEHELLLVQQAEMSGDKNIYQDLVRLLITALKARVQYLTQLIEPGVTVITGGLVAFCVYTMLYPVLQLQQGLTF